MSNWGQNCFQRIYYDTVSEWIYLLQTKYCTAISHVRPPWNVLKKGQYICGQYHARNPYIFTDKLVYWQF